MARRSQSPPLSLVRSLLLAALVITVGVVGALFLLGRTERGSEKGRVRPTTENLAEAIFTGKGFEHAVTRDGRRLFLVAADRVISERENVFVLEGVRLEVDRENGLGYRLESRRAVYHRDTDETLLEGGVRLWEPSPADPRERGGLELRAKGLELQRQGNRVVSTSEVEVFFADRFAGSAGQLMANFQKDLFVLSGGVLIASLPGEPEPVGVECQRLALDRQEHLLRLEEDVVLRRGEDELRGRRFSLLLSEDDKRPRFLRAIWEVDGRYRQGRRFEAARVLSFQGDDLAVKWAQAGGDFEQAVLAGRGGPVVAASLDGSGWGERIRALRLRADFADGVVARVEAEEQVEVHQLVALQPPFPVRRLCGRQAIALFDPSGAATEVVVEGGVELGEGGIQATGERLTSRFQEQSNELVGDPVRIETARGSVETPRLVHSGVTGEVQATEGVRGVMVAARRGGLPLAREEGKGEGGREESLPVRIEAREAVWSLGGSAVILRGKVRAWQGESFLLAEELQGLTGESRLLASGGVRTVWQRPEPAPTEEGEEERAGESRTAQTVQIDSREMVFARQQGLLTYSGEVRAQEAGRVLRCRDLDVRLGEEEEIESLLCRGSALIEDRAGGKTVSGDEALYDPRAGTVRVAGRPAVLTDAPGTQIRGRVMTYDFESGTAQMESRESEAEAEQEGSGGTPTPPEAGADESGDPREGAEGIQG